MSETNEVKEEDKDYFHDWEEIFDEEEDYHQDSEQVYNPYEHLID
jgi:hypothetical protein